MKAKQKIAKSKWVERSVKFKFFFGWLYWFYPKAKKIEPIYLLYFFFFQKVLRINGSVPWPVHFTSRILNKSKIQIGERTAPGMNASCYIQGKAGIIIGDNLRMGPGVGLISANHNVDDYDEWLDEGPIVIGNNVWIGMNVVVLPGVKIGDNVIIAANSVVTKEIPSNVIAGGTPCKVLKEKGPYLGKDYSK